MPGDTESGSARRGFPRCPCAIDVELGWSLSAGDHLQVTRTVPRPHGADPDAFQTAARRGALPIRRFLFTTAEALPVRHPSLLWPRAEAQCRAVAHAYLPLRRRSIVQALATGSAVNTSLVRRESGTTCPHSLAHEPSGWGSDPPPSPNTPGRSPVFPANESLFKGEFRSGDVKDRGLRSSSEPPQSGDCERFSGSVGQLVP